MTASTAVRRDGAAPDRVTAIPDSTTNQYQAAIHALAATWPTLTPAQRDALATLLRPARQEDTR